MTTLTPILTKFWDDPQSWTLATYEKNEGYQALKKALTMAPAALVDGNALFVVGADDVARKRPVTIGASDADFVEITAAPASRPA